MFARFDASLIEDNLPSGAPVLLALSGGGDSRAALAVLAEHCAAVGRPLGAAHLDHAIRPRSAEDADFCAAICAESGVAFHTRRVDVPALAVGGKGLEEAAREVRYAFFAELMAEHGYAALITAHQAEDNLETMLMRLTRGSGLRGLCGIPPMRPFGGGLLLRPFLRASRAELEAYLAERGLTYLTDETNADTVYLRNRLRAEVLPVLADCNPALLRRAADTAEALRADEAYLADAAERLWRSLPAPDQADAAWLAAQPTAMRRRLYVRLFNACGGEGMLEQTHFVAIDRLLVQPTGVGEVSLPASVRARLEGGVLAFLPDGVRLPAIPADWRAEAVCGETVFDELGAVVWLLSAEEMQKKENNWLCETNIYRLFITRQLNFDKIIGKPYWRIRASGDRILMGGHHRSVKKLLSTARVPIELRDRLPILCDEEGIVFLPAVGLRDGLSDGNFAVAVAYPSPPMRKSE